MNFIQDVRQQIIDLLCTHTKKKKLQARQELEAKSDRDLAIIYFNWILRLIPPQPRQVHVASSVYTSPILVDLGKEFGLILRALERGDDLNDHLSEGALSIAYAAGSKSDSFDKDGLLNHWGIHHLHFFPTSDRQARKQKGRGRLIFVVIKPTDAYILALGHHRDFANSELIRVMSQEWPSLVEPFVLKGVVGLAGPGYTPDELVQLRKAGISALTEVDGKVYIPGAITTAGTSDDAGIRASKLLRAVKSLREWCASNEAAIRGAIGSVGKPQPTSLKLKAVLQWDRLVVVEEESSVGLRFRDA